jgi:biofilm PGA synthesis N-glycosyltransferase PgaC
MDPWVLLFWICNGVLAIAYLVYPAVVAAVVALKWDGTAHRETGRCLPPRVAFVIPAYNERAVIGDKILNTLALCYPSELLRIIVVTDGSNDGTPGSVASFPMVIHLHEPERRGKPHAMNRGAAVMGEAEVLVFSDANTRLTEGALASLVAPFSDPSVGAVCGEKRVQSLGDKSFAGEGAYWDYESRLKKLDSALGTVVGPVGELLAVRAVHWRPIPEDTVLDDMHIGLRVCMDGSRVAYASGSVALEPPSRSLSDEWERKVRISAGSYQSLGRFASLLNPFRHGVVSVQFLFRKVFRWVLCPPALLMVLPAAFFTVKAGHEPRWFFLSALLCWGIFAVLTGLGWMLYGTAFGRKKVFQLPFYFTFMHAATLAGMIRHLLGGQSVVWRKAVR